MSAFASGTKGLLVKNVLADATRLVMDPGKNLIPLIINIDNIVAIDVDPFALPRLPKGEYVENTGVPATDDDAIKYAVLHSDEYISHHSAILRQQLIPEEYLVAQPDGEGLPTEPLSFIADGLIVLRLSGELVDPTGPGCIDMQGELMGDIMCSVHIGDKYSIAPGRLIATPLNRIVFNSPRHINQIRPQLYSPTTHTLFGRYGEPVRMQYGYDSKLNALYIEPPLDYVRYQPVEIGDYVIISQYFITNHGDPGGVYLSSYVISKTGLRVYKKEEWASGTGASRFRYLLTPMPRILQDNLKAIGGDAEVTASITIRALCMKMLLKITCVDTSAHTQQVTPVLEL